MLKRIFGGKRVVLPVISALLIVVLTATSAFAEFETGVLLTAGTLSGGDITFGGGSFADVAMDGTQKTKTNTWDISNVIDARGSGFGWKLSLTLTPLAEYDTIGVEYVASGHTFASGSIKVTTAPIVSLADATSSLANTITPVVNTTSLDTGTPVKILSAAINGGMGSFAITSMGVTLTVPASTFVAQYKSDAIVAISTGP